MGDSVSSVVNIEPDLIKRIRRLEQSNRRAGETLRNAKTIVRKFEACCNEYDPDLDLEVHGDKSNKLEVDGSIFQCELPLVTMPKESLFQRSTKEDAVTSFIPVQGACPAQPEPNIPLPGTEHACTQVDTAGTISGRCSYRGLNTVVSQMKLLKTAASTFVVAADPEDQRPMSRPSIEIISQKDIDTLTDVSSNEPNALFRPTQQGAPEAMVSVCDHDKPSRMEKEKPSNEYNSPHVKVPSINLVFSKAQQGQQQIKPSIRNNIAAGLVVIDKKLTATNTKQNQGKLTQHVSNCMAPATKKIKFQPNRKGNKEVSVLEVIRTCEVKPPALKVDEWLSGLDPRFGTMIQWASPDTDDEDAENAPSLHERSAFQPGTTKCNEEKSGKEQRELKLMDCTFCKKRLSLDRCPRPTPRKRLNCDLCERDMLETSYHRHMRKCHGNTAKTQCNICKVVLPFSIIQKHTTLVHTNRNANFDDDIISVGTVLQDEPMENQAY